MSIDSSLIGKSSLPQTFTVEQEAMQRFLEATEDPALQNGASPQYVPPTFPTTFRMSVPGLELDGSRMQIIHGQQEYKYTRRLHIGEQVTCVARIVDVRTRHSSTGSISFIISEITGSDSTARQIFTARSTLVVRQ